MNDPVNSFPSILDKWGYLSDLAHWRFHLSVSVFFSFWSAADMLMSNLPSRRYWGCRLWEEVEFVSVAAFLASTSALSLPSTSLWAATHHKVMSDLLHLCFLRTARIMLLNLSIR